MPGFSLSMRWWLGAAFAAIAAVTAVIVAQGVAGRSEAAFREDAEKRALQHSTAASAALAAAFARGNVDDAIASVAAARGLAMFVVGPGGRPVTGTRNARTDLAAVPNRREAVAAALDRRTYVRSYEQGRVTVVALPMRWRSSAALLTYSVQPGYGGTMTMIRDQIAAAVIWAVVLGGIAGFAVAALTARRLRAIAAAARAIEEGDFTRRRAPRLHDEVGAVAVALDRMRAALLTSIERIQTERLHLRRTLERLDHGVVSVDRELVVEHANGAARRILGDARIREGKPLPDAPPGRSLRTFARALFGDDSAVVRAGMVSESGSFAVAGIPAGDAVPTALLVITEMSERERLERAEREFVTNAAHELRTPIAAISSAVEVLEAGAKRRAPERDHFLAIIGRQSDRLARLSRALLALARAQTGRDAVPRSAVDLCPLLESVAADLQPGEDVAVTVDCAEGLAVLADPDLLDQVISNLAANAASHTERGRIELRARALDDDSVSIELVDTGHGIARGERARVFDRFYRGENPAEGGFGLGLAIVRQAVVALDGTVEVGDGPELGTRISVTLPLARLA